MRLIKFFLSAILLIVIVGAGGYYAFNHFFSDKVASVSSTYQKVRPIADMAYAKAVEVWPKNLQVGKVLGAFQSQPSSSPTVAADPNHQPQPFEKARFSYCQQVIKDYETRYSSATTSAHQ